MADAQLVPSQPAVLHRFTCRFKRRCRRTRGEVFPVLSRIQNIGYEKGENSRTPQWYRTHHRTPWVAAHGCNGSFALNCTQ